jgi:hypothetical protein
MQAIDINLATRPFRNNTLLWGGLVAVLVALALATAWNVRTYRLYSELLADLRQREATSGARRTELERRQQQARRELERVDLELLDTKAAKANEVIRRKAFSWTRLFNLLQEVQPYDVQMTSIHPMFQAARGQLAGDVERVPVSVEGVAKTLEDFFELEDNLHRNAHFARVEPERTETEDTSGEVVFRLRFLYDPRDETEAKAATEAAEADGTPAGAAGAGGDPAADADLERAADAAAAGGG